MKIYNDFDEKLYIDIAKATNVKQTIADVRFAKKVEHFGKSIYAERIDEEAWLLGYSNKDSFRIIGMATRESAQGKGYGTILLRRLINHCRKNGIKKITTRTLSGVGFYRKKANAKIVGEKDGDYLLEITI